MESEVRVSWEANKDRKAYIIIIVLQELEKWWLRLLSKTIHHLLHRTFISSVWIMWWHRLNSLLLHSSYRCKTFVPFPVIERRVKWCVYRLGYKSETWDRCIGQFDCFASFLAFSSSFSSLSHDAPFFLRLHTSRRDWSVEQTPACLFMSSWWKEEHRPDMKS